MDEFLLSLNSIENQYYQHRHENFLPGNSLEEFFNDGNSLLVFNYIISSTFSRIAF